MLSFLGYMLFLETGLMIIPIVTAFYYKEVEIKAFIIAAFITYTIGFICYLAGKNADKFELKTSKGFSIVSTAWIMTTLLGSLPFIFGGTFNNITDAVFESVSGFTTTGATVIMSPESLAKSILLWRSLTHWFGGLGIIVMGMAILPNLAVRMHIYRAEVTGFDEETLFPDLKKSLQVLLKIYLSLSLFEFILLIFNDVNVFEALVHTMGTISTGGFSSKALSISSFSSVNMEIIIIIFMFLGGMNFNLLYQASERNFKKLFNDEELRLYIFIVILASLLITFNLYLQGYGELFKIMRDSFFQVVSFITTTGYITVNYDTWPSFARWILLVLMFTGASAGSTSGGIKLIRILVLFKKGKQELDSMLYPRSIRSIKVNNILVNEKISTGVLGFFFLYIVTFMVACLVLTSYGHDLISSVSAVAATLGNIGPGFELVGPRNTFQVFPDAAKWVLIICMLMGRLEIYTFLAFIYSKFNR